MRERHGRGGSDVSDLLGDMQQFYRAHGMWTPFSHEMFVPLVSDIAGMSRLSIRTIYTIS